MSFSRRRGHGEPAPAAASIQSHKGPGHTAPFPAVRSYVAPEEEHSGDKTAEFNAALKEAGISGIYWFIGPADPRPP